MAQDMNTSDNVRRVRLFRNGRSQAVRIPKEFELEGDEVEMSQTDDGTLVLRKVEKVGGLAGYLDWKRTQPVIAESEWPAMDDSDLLPPEDVDL